MSDELRLVDNALSRRSMLINLATVGLAAGSLAPIGQLMVTRASAQESSPEPNVFPPDELPILELEIDADGAIHTNAQAQSGSIDEGVSHMSGQAQAGTTVIRCTSNLAGPATVFFLYRPEVSMNDVAFRQSVLAPGPRWWMYDQPLTATFEFDPERTPLTQELVVDVAPGLWRIIVLGTVQTFTTMEFVGDGAFVEIPVGVTVQAEESGFDMPTEIPAGKQVWRFSNHDETLHEFGIYASAQLLSTEEAASALAASEATPAAEADGAMEKIARISFISGGQTTYQEIDLAPGKYIGACSIADAGSSTPHFQEGMIAAFTVV